MSPRQPLRGSQLNPFLREPFPGQRGRRGEELGLHSDLAGGVVVRPASWAPAPQQPGGGPRAASQVPPAGCCFPVSAQAAQHRLPRKTRHRESGGGGSVKLMPSEGSPPAPHPTPQEGPCRAPRPLTSSSLFSHPRLQKALASTLLWPASPRSRSWQRHWLWHLGGDKGRPVTGGAPTPTGGCLALPAQAEAGLEWSPPAPPPPARTPPVQPPHRPQNGSRNGRQHCQARGVPPHPPGMSLP